jgi:hypothetical protein
MTDHPTAYTEEQALRLFPSLRSLVLLRDAAWVFLPVDDADAKLDGCRSWAEGWRDCIRVNSETDALGLRIRIPADQHSKPEIVSEFAGTLIEVVEHLLALPAPDSRLAPSLAIGSAPLLWIP